MLKQNLPTIVAVLLVTGTLAVFKHFGVMSGWPNIPLGPVTIPIRGEYVQVLLSGLAGFLPMAFERVLSVQWMSDVVAAPTRIRELHAVKPQLLSGANAAIALGQTATVVTKPVEAEKPAT